MMKKWKEIKGLKIQKEIKYDGEVLFVMQEMTGNKLDAFWNMIVTKAEKDNADKTSGEFVIDVEGDLEMVVYAIRNLVIDVDFEEMTDDELLEEMNEFSQEILDQINLGIKELLIDKIMSRLDALNLIANKVE